MAMVIASIDADGWQAVYPAVPEGPLILSDLVVTRAGFTATGAAASFSETLKLTRRIRRPYPNQATLTADKVAISDFVYAGDSIASVVNNSTLISPKPIAKWASLDRSLVANSVTPELTAFHRDGIAYVEFRATDGTTTVTAGTETQLVLGASYDQCAVLGYKATLDLTSLTSGLITVHAKVYPKLGGAGSVLDSNEKSERREFSARYYRKDTALVAAPVYAYVSTTGNDTTGAVSTSAGTAEVTPCATVAGAMVRINAVHGALDGCVIRLMAGTHTLTGSSTSRTQNTASFTITRDPNAAKAAVILQWGVGAARLRLLTGINAAINTGCVRFYDITMVRTGALTFMGEASCRLEVQAEDCGWGNGAFAASPFNNSDGWWHGLAYSGAAASASQPVTQGGHVIWRGCSGAMSNAHIDGYCMLGCNFTGIGRTSPGNLRTGDGSIRAFNRLSFATNLGGYVGVDSNASELVGQAVVQNVFEGLPNTSFTAAILSADSSIYSMTQLLFMQNTIIGFYDAARSNILYNETPGQARFHTLHRVAGNIHVQLNTKHDVFIMDGTRTGGWSYLYGVGCEGEFSQFRDAGSGSFAQAYAGVGANIGTSSSVRNDPLFLDYRGATAGAVGQGGGDYRLRAGSPAIGILPREYLAFDLHGVRRARRVAGALEADLPLTPTLRAQSGRLVLGSSGAGLSLTGKLAVAAARHSCRDPGAALGVAMAWRAGPAGRQVRVEEDSRTLWARRD